MTLPACPFCGSLNARIVTSYLDYEGALSGYCPDCKAWGPAVPINLKDIKGTKAKAELLWSIRSMFAIVEDKEGN